MIERLKLVGLDRLRYDRTALRLASLAAERRELLRRPRSCNQSAASIRSLARAARAGTGLRNIGRAERRIAELLAAWSPEAFAWDQFFPDTAATSIRKAIVLKRPIPPAEKGVLFVAFETHWVRLLRHAHLTALARDYDLVLSPTWSPPQELALYLASRLWPAPLFSLISNFRDMDSLETISPRLRVVPLLASHWVLPGPPQAAPAPKPFDVAVLANFAAYKRHFALFRALAHMAPGTRALLIGTPWSGRGQDALEREAALYGVRGQIEIRAVPHHEVFQALRSAKVSVILSRGEGSCVAVAESLFADVPVGMLEDARVGSSVFINAHTGRFLRERRLSRDLEEFVAHHRDYQPRAWALRNHIDCRASSAVLNDCLRTAALAQGRPWTVDVVPMQWRPNASYVCEQDQAALRGEYTRFPGRYGVSIEL